MCHLCRHPLYVADCQEKDSAKNPVNVEVPEFGGTVCCWVGEVGWMQLIRHFVQKYVSVF